MRALPQHAGLRPRPHRSVGLKRTGAQPNSLMINGVLRHGLAKLRNTLVGDLGALVTWVE